MNSSILPSSYYQLDPSSNFVSIQNKQDQLNSIRFSQRKEEIPEEAGDTEKQIEEQGQEKTEQVEQKNVQVNADNSETIKGKDPNIKYEGWLRLALITGGKEKQYPNIHIKDNQYHEFQFLNETEIRQLDLLPDFGRQRKNFQYKKDGPIPQPDAFFFRINQNDQMYYTETDTDTVVLGALRLNSFKAEPTDNKDCFQVQGQDHEMWILCSVDGVCPNAWKYAISHVMGSEFKGCKPPAGKFKSDKQAERKFISVQPMLIIPTPAPYCSVDFDYQKNGQDWVCHCNEGGNQSPVELPHKQSAQFQIESPFKTQYNRLQPDQVEVVFHQGKIKIRPIDNHSFGFLTDNNGGSETVYEVTEIEFHTPAEHSFQGESRDMEVQIVHKYSSGDFPQNQAVVSFLYKRYPGEYMRGFSKIDTINLPNPKENVGHNVIKSAIHPLDFIFNDEGQANENGNFDYYKYYGTMTSPPCAGNTVWFVSSEKLELSSTIIAMFQESLKDIDHPEIKIYGNNRNQEPWNDRGFEFYDSNFGKRGTIIHEVQDLTGHYEKVTQNEDFVRWVQGNNPADGAIMSDDEVEQLGLSPLGPDHQF